MSHPARQVVPDPSVEIRLVTDDVPPPARRRGAGWGALAASLGVCCLIVGLWELQSRRFTGSTVGSRVRGAVVQDASGNDDLARTLNEIPAATGPRIVMFGSSQVHSVKDDPDFSTRAIPFQMTELARVAPGYQVVDLSGPAQQAFESMAILLGNERRLKPTVVVLGLGLFNMLTTDIRPTIRTAARLDTVRAAIAALPPSAITTESRQALLSSVNVGGGATASDSTIQQRVDSRLERALSGQSAMVANRRAMYNALIDVPLRRDLVELLQRRRGPMRTARTYGIDQHYSGSLAAVGAMGEALAREGVRFVVMIMPFEHTRAPVLYTPETKARLTGDLSTLAKQHHFSVLDLSDSLRVDDFGLYVDGSPDGLHFRARGHAVAGQALARFIAPMLGQVANGQTTSGR